MTPEGPARGRAGKRFSKAGLSWGSPSQDSGRAGYGSRELGSLPAALQGCSLHTSPPPSQCAGVACGRGPRAWAWPEGEGVACGCGPPGVGVVPCMGVACGEGVARVWAWPVQHLVQRKRACLSIVLCDQCQATLLGPHEPVCQPVGCWSCSGAPAVCAAGSTRSPCWDFRGGQSRPGRSRGP